MTDAAQQLNVARVTLSRVLNGRAAISPEMALRIEAWLGIARGGEARLWLAEQCAYDMVASAAAIQGRADACSTRADGRLMVHPTSRARRKTNRVNWP